MNRNTCRRSLSFAFIGGGEGGGRMAATFGRMGYPAAAINTAEADLWDAFNRLSVRESEFYSALDGTDYLRLLSAGKCAALGYAEVVDLKSSVRLARAMSEAVHGGLLVNGFDFATASAVGTIIVGSANTLRHLLAAYLDNGLRVVGEIMRGGYTFSGVYANSGVYAKLKLYVLFGGLDLPLERVEELAQDTQGEYEVLQEKLQTSNLQPPISNLSFLEGGLRLERGGSTGLTTGGNGHEGNVFAQMANRGRR